MKRLLWISGLALLLAAPAKATEPKCPLDVQTCLDLFGRLHERPWLGIEVETDSTGMRIIQGVVPGGPADRAGIQPGDRMQRIDGNDPAKWFAGKAGWKDAPPVALSLQRAGHPLALSVTPGRIPEEYLAHMIGVHMLEGHLAYANTGEHEKH